MNAKDVPIEVGQVWRTGVSRLERTITRIMEPDGVAFDDLTTRSFEMLRENGTLVQFADGFSPWAGGTGHCEAPVVGEVDVRLRSGALNFTNAADVDWAATAFDPVIAYKLVEGTQSQRDDFTAWHGGTQPQDTVDKVLYVKLRCGEENVVDNANSCEWAHGTNSPQREIVAYKVVGSAKPPLGESVHCSRLQFDRMSLAADMLTELGYRLAGNCWVAPEPNPLKDNQDAQMLQSAHEVIRIWNKRATECGFDGVSAMLSALQRKTVVVQDTAALPATAIQMLCTARQHMEARAATYDKPAGERSMAATVVAFNAQTGRDLTEDEGWLLMVNLKIVRDRQVKAGHIDSCEDLVSYSALYGESRLANH